MARTLDDIMAELPKERRDFIEQRGAEILNEYLTLQELRKAKKLTQKKLAESLNVNQENISRLEKRSDMMLSTLRGYVEAMGGKLELTVRFPKHTPISLKGIGDDASNL
ncbi:MAG: XRE family transcriptional regulator [Alteromonadaceae bacterium]|nr:XRE family transcriptional regulator [Alteromonadaceae bacterium]